MDAKLNATQVAAYIVSGTGFLAGAVIFEEGFSVRDLNTAATLRATAAGVYGSKARALGL
jgi:putative Mg2+ transporter-C (MgtC) family protein